MDTHQLKALETHSPPPDSTISQQTLGGSSPIPPLPPPPLQTLDGSFSSSCMETLNGSLPSSQVKTLNASSHLGTLDEQQPNQLSTLDGSLPFQAETLDDDSNSDFLADVESVQAEGGNPLPPWPYHSNGNYLSTHWPGSSPSHLWSTHTEAKPRWLSGTEAKPSNVGAGLANIGNTCFLNAVLQCFTHTVPLIQGLRSCDHTMPCVRASEDFCVLCALRDHIEYSLAHSGEIVSPYELADNLSYISSCFRRFQQEDAHEFLQCLLDRLDSCCLDSKTQDESLSSHGDNFVKLVFGGCLISKLRCCNCGHCSDTYEPLIDLSLEIEDVDNLPSALESFTKVEKIEDPETKFTCENCKEEVLVEKQFMLDQAPLVAAFHLKRFKNDGSYVEKIDKHVEYPLELDLGPYTSGSQDCSVELKYELYAIVVHVGFSSTSGHYFCFIRSSPDTWHKLDDSQVTRVREESVLSQEAYILFYARQGTPWFSSIMEAKKTCLDPDILNTSPKSVLDNVDNICTSSPSVANGYSCGVNETGDAAEGISVQFCSGSRHDGDDVNEAMVGVNEVRDDTQRIIALMPLGASDSCNETLSNDEDMCTASALKENNCNQETNEVRNNVNIHPQTPPRSLSPDTFSKECPEVQYHIPRDHLRSEKQVACKRPLDKALEDSKRALEDSKRREAVRYVTKQMPVSRGMKLLAAIARSEGSPNKKRNKRKMGLSPCKRASPPCARRRHSHRVVMRPLAAASLR